MIRYFQAIAEQISEQSWRGVGGGRTQDRFAVPVGLSPAFPSVAQVNFHKILNLRLAYFIVHTLSYWSY